MDALIQWLIDAGPAGMFIAAFLAGSVFPLSSEVVMLALLGAGSNPTGLLIWGTTGNILGSMFNYGIGRLGREDWILRFTKVSPEKLKRGRHYVRRYGAWAGLLAWIPVVGELITVAMGFLRTNALLSFITIGAGKYVRYQILVSAWLYTQG